jgi:dihydroorotate dehydrogenase (fumarate)
MAVAMGRLDAILKFGPPLINSATPWATTIEHLRTLYHCPFTSAVTVRTSTLRGFSHDDSVHQYTFFDPSNLETDANAVRKAQSRGSLNTLGYSPIPLKETLSNILNIVSEGRHIQNETSKPFIISITGSPADVSQCIEEIRLWRDHGLYSLGDTRIYVEINLSCPNISGTPPPAFNQQGLETFLECIANAGNGPATNELSLGIKLPPYSNPENFEILRTAIMEYAHAPGVQNGLSLELDFITTCNTLGCSLLLDDSLCAKLSSADGMGIGGLAGAPLHPIALGNVALLRKMLDSDLATSHIPIIGIGGVSDTAGFSRMQAAGAAVVGVGTAFGIEGIDVFEHIVKPENLQASHHGASYIT